MKLTFIIILISSVITYSQTPTINSISFLNTQKMDLKFLKKITSTKTGQVVDSTLIKKDIAFLKRLNGISNATFTINYTLDNECDLLFNIQENKTVIPSVSIWSTINNVAFNLGLYNYNLNGKNTTIGGYYQYNNFHSGGFTYSSPYLFSNQFGLETNIQQLSSKEPLFFNNSAANYQYTNTSFELLGIYQINFINRIKIGGAIFNEQYSYLDGVTSPSIPQELNINKLLLKIEHSYNNIEYNYYLLDGIKNNLFIQIVNDTSFDKKSFLISWNDFCTYVPSGNKGNWATRIRLGLSSNTKSPFAPFSVDNNMNIRGVGNIIDRGTGSIVVNTEYRKTLFEKKWFVLQGNVFIDSGTWRTPGGTWDDFYSSENIRIYPGAGVRFIHKTIFNAIFNAIFRIDYGYGITPNSSHGMVFGIGQYF